MEHLFGLLVGLVLGLLAGVLLVSYFAGRSLGDSLRREVDAGNVSRETARRIIDGLGR